MAEVPLIGAEILFRNSEPLLRDQYTTLSQFQQQSQKVDNYWKSHASNKGVN